MIIDLLCVVVLLYGGYLGYTNGVLQSLFNVVGVLLAFLGAMRLTPVIAEVLSVTVSSDTVGLPVVAFLMAFLAILMALRLVNLALMDNIRKVAVSDFNRVGGASLMALLFIFLGSALLQFSVMSQIVTERQQRESQLYPYVSQMPMGGIRLIESIFPITKDFMEYMRHSMNKGVPKSDYFEYPPADSLAPAQDTSGTTSNPEPEFE